VNGALHLGHAYVALLNEALAHASGGQFLVRFVDRGGTPQIARLVESQRADLLWLGLTVDGWALESSMLPVVNERLTTLGVTVQEEAVYPHVPRLLLPGRLIAYPYTPTYTAQKVLMDEWQGVTLLVRGLDLVTEYSLYTHYCRQFGVPEPEHVYVPRLLSYQGDITKTNGGYKIAELRANGYTPQDVRAMLAKACLHIPPNGWTLDNLREEPRL
jgi:glutamyl/glutaminyl-tRNA synthetase